MKALTKDQVAEQAKLVERFNDAVLSVRAKEEDYEAAANDLNGAIDDLNDVINDMSAFADDIVSQIDDFVSEKSEAWQESERGEAYSEWSVAWQEVEHEIGPVDNIEIGSVDIPDIDTFEDRPTEPEI